MQLLQNYLNLRMSFQMRTFSLHEIEMLLEETDKGGDLNNALFMLIRRFRK